jgi:group I intron endonuclease
MKISGIYKIESKSDNTRCYIGSAININSRWQLHIAQLKKGLHHSIKLQRHFNKYGESDLQFSILLSCDKCDLLKVEQYFIDSYNPYFNICKIAGSSLGIKRSKKYLKKISESHKGYKMPESQKLRISETLKGKKKPIGFGEKLSLKQTGKKRTSEAKEKMSLVHLGLQAKEKHPLWGKKHSKESIEKMKKSHKGHIPWNKGLKRKTC